MKRVRLTKRRRDRIRGRFQAGEETLEDREDIIQLIKNLDEAEETVEEAEATLEDEEAAHQETLRMLEWAKKDLADHDQALRRVTEEIQRLRWEKQERTEAQWWEGGGGV